MKNTKDKWQKLQTETSEWAIDKFKLTSPMIPLHHLSEEILETKENPHDINEYADMMLLLIQGAFLANISMDELLGACKAKFEINKKREWVENENGTFSHVKNTVSYTEHSCFDSKIKDWETK